MFWLNPLDAKVRSAVVSGYWGKLPHSFHFAAPPEDPDEIDVLADVLEQASDILTEKTGGSIHPALQVVEDFVCYPNTARLSPSLAPLREVVALQTLTDTGALSTSQLGVVAHGDNVRFVDTDEVTPNGYSWAMLDAWWFLRQHCACPALARLRLTYNAGSTITASARQAVLALAHELYLRVSPCDECGTCRLPLRTTNVIREGISYNVGDPLDATGSAMGATGLPDVDIWLRGVNPRQATRASAVYTTDAPPPVVRSLVSATPHWPVPLTSRLGTAANITATGSVS
jgi:hypothetical protein